MKLKVLATSLLIASGLVGCGQGIPFGKAPASGVSTPALPIIQDAVTSLAPTFNGKSVPVLVNQLCALAQGQLTQEQSNAQLVKMGIDASKLQHNGPDALALLVNGDRAGQATACAAYQVSAALEPLNPNEILSQAPAPKESTEEHAEKGKDAQKKAGDAQTPQYVINQDRANKLFRLRVAQARATADTFAYIGERLEQIPGLTPAQYKAKARELFVTLAPAYTGLVQQYLPAETTHYYLVQLSELETDFNSDAGVRYKASRIDGVALSLNGQAWLGRGQILGKDIRLSANYFPGADKAASNSH
ncbi:hypothetical protein JVX91_16935 [Pseudomonas sp. PDNC002]|uniref:hypothetical protein n=1 Tax=Pseudomonas sp. PDNC002 TaxID=2811422 RepID=UPI0019624DFD|nr:hypothetical protein [Pseudomonas sp. PDNC002]QRY77295.1 hypothetical protein JVX91_16935 [Pseudomonas sp. PDNC002]